MRIITGTARATKLITPEGLQTRPTSERAKMGIFNILQFEIKEKRVLDLFAGSGQMALEALSRGATNAILVDCDEDAIRCIEANIRKTHMEDKAKLISGDFKTVLRSIAGKQSFDLVFLDPPYKTNYLESALILLLKHQLLAPGATIVCETAPSADIKPPHSLSIARVARYGTNTFTVLTFTKEECS